MRLDGYRRTALSLVVLSVLLLVSAALAGAETKDFAVRFTSDEMGINLGNKLPPLGKVFTIEVWFKQDLTRGYQTIISRQLWGDEDFSLAIEAGKPVASITYNGVHGDYKVNPYLAGKTRATVGEWHHYAFVADGNEFRLYLDGKLECTRPLKDMPHYFPKLVVVVGRKGQNQSQQYPFLGALDELRISNVARYTSDFVPTRTRFEPDENTVGLWHMDEGDGLAVNDAGPNKFNGTIEASKKALAENNPWVPGFTSEQ